MARLRRLKITLVVVASLALLLVAFVVLTALTAPGRRGLAGAEARASAWRTLPPLRELADRAGVRFGTAVMVRDMRGDPRYSPLLAREFNSVTPFVEMKWGTIHPERDRYDFSQAGELVADRAGRRGAESTSPATSGGPARTRCGASSSGTRRPSSSSSGRGLSATSTPAPCCARDASTWATTGRSSRSTPSPATTPCSTAPSSTTTGR